jgi:hypothetical protein
MEKITESQAVRSVIDSIKENAIQGCRTLNLYLENYDVIHTLFIENLDETGRSYYIVYWLIDLRILCIAEVDAVDGTVLSFTPFTHPGSEHYHNFMKAEEIIHDRFHEDEFLSSSLVWKPCQESTSSLFPFRRVITREHTYFMSITGDIYQELTPVTEG